MPINNHAHPSNNPSYVVVNGNHSRLTYLGFDDSGNREWKKDRLDAVRFNSEKDIYESCKPYIKNGARIRKIDPWDGYYESYMGCEVQVYKDNLKGIPGGKRWRFRVGINLYKHTAFEPEDKTKKGYTTPQEALKQAKLFIDRQAKTLTTD